MFGDQGRNSLASLPSHLEQATGMRLVLNLILKGLYKRREERCDWASKWAKRHSRPCEVQFASLLRALYRDHERCQERRYDRGCFLGALRPGMLEQQWTVSCTCHLMVVIPVLRKHKT